MILPILLLILLNDGFKAQLVAASSGNNSIFSLGTGNSESSENVIVKIGDNLARLTCPILRKVKTYSQPLPSKNKTSSLVTSDELISFDTVQWIVDKDNIMIGANVNYDFQKYDYHASSGQLVIWDLETNDLGLYHCLARFGYGTSATTKYKVGSVLVSLKGGNSVEGGWYDENKTNIVRGAIAAGVAGCVISFLCIICKYGWHTPRKATTINITPAQGSEAQRVQANRIKCVQNHDDRSGKAAAAVGVGVCVIDFDDDEDDYDHEDAEREKKDWRLKSNEQQKYDSKSCPSQQGKSKSTLNEPEKTNKRTRRGNSIEDETSHYREKSSSSGYPLSTTPERLVKKQSPSPTGSTSSRL